MVIIQFANAGAQQQANEKRVQQNRNYTVDLQMSDFDEWALPLDFERGESHDEGEGVRGIEAG